MSKPYPASVTYEYALKFCLSKSIIAHRVPKGVEESSSKGTKKELVRRLKPVTTLKRSDVEPAMKSLTVLEKQEFLDL